MAGEVDDCVAYQADSLSSSSISFGRFESENLSWERRSSFSHNRYLEEVEKCATPGSVTQKKAYFEAHFKQKGLFHQTSSERQHIFDCLASENDNEELSNKEFVDDGDRGESKFACYDDTQAVSDKHERIEFEQEEVVSELELPSEHKECNDGCVMNCNDGPENDDAFQAQGIASDTNDTHIIPSKMPESVPIGVEELAEERNTTSECLTNKKVESPGFEKIKDSLLVEEKPELKSPKTNLGSQLAVAQGSKKPSNGRSSVTSAKIKAQDRETKLRTESHKLLPSRVLRCSETKVQKSQDFPRKNAEVKRVNISQNSFRGKNNTTRSHPSAATRDIEQPTSRSIKVSISSKTKTKQSSAVFSFRSDVRAEKRKEFYMKLEEKLHAKESEMNEIQAKTQEEAEAKMKQFRRSLNFKATPMPSFYREALSGVSDGKKIVPPSVKSLKVHAKSTTPGNKTLPRERSPASPSSQPKLTSHSDVLSASEGMDAISSPANGTCGSEELHPSKRNEPVKKAERTKLKYGGSRRWQQKEFRSK